MKRIISCFFKSWYDELLWFYTQWKSKSKLAADCSKYSFEVADKADEVSSKYGFEGADKIDEVSNYKHGKAMLRGFEEIFEDFDK